MAQRSKQTVQKAPLPISFVRREDLVRTNVTRAEDLTRVVPALIAATSEFPRLCQDEHDQEYSVEARFVGKAGPVDFMVGGYYFNELIKTQPRSTSLPSRYSRPTSPAPMTAATRYRKRKRKR